MDTSSTLSEVTFKTSDVWASKRGIRKLSETQSQASIYGLSTNNWASFSVVGTIHWVPVGGLVSEISDPSVRVNQGRSERRSKEGGDDESARYSMTLCVAFKSNDGPLSLASEPRNILCNERGDSTESWKLLTMAS